MTDPLRQHLDAALAAAPMAALCVGYSGGPDSSALLHALAQLPAARQRGLRAVHVDHGLNPHSTAWANHCRAFCAALNVPCDIVRVNVDPASGLGLEAAARDARRMAFVTHMAEGEYLLLAHHRDDQVETVLLKLLRGAGPEGLGGMHERRPFGPGQLWRPLLQVSRQQLRRYVDAHRLECIDDPSNQDTQLARNYLRHEILPRLQHYWPQTTDSVIHSASLCREAAGSLQQQWQQAFDTLHDPITGTLDANGWLALAGALREPLLDHWLHGRGLGAPTTAQRRQIERQCRARAGQLPCIRWPGTVLHIWRGRLWVNAPAASVEPDEIPAWLGETLRLADGGMLSLDPPQARLPMPLQLRFRRGGERIKPAGDAYTRELRDLFQAGSIPPWQRSHFPLLYLDDELVAVADRWISTRAEALLGQAGARLRWQSAD